MTNTNEDDNDGDEDGSVDSEGEQEMTSDHETSEVYHYPHPLISL